MFSLDSSRGGRGAGYIILNILRCINMLILATIAASSVVLMVVAKMPNGFTFFNDISLLFIVGVCIIFIISECEFKWSQGYFEEHWPVIAPHRGFTWLGVGMIVMGSHTLGELSDSRNNPDSMSLPFWRLCIAAGILAIVFGVANIVSSWLFSTKGQGARSVRNDGAQSTTQAPAYDTYSSHSSNYSHNEKPQARSFSFYGNKSKINRSDIGAPIPQDLEAGHGEDRRSPIIPEIQRPDSVLHPANRA